MSDQDVGLPSSNGPRPLVSGFGLVVVVGVAIVTALATTLLLDTLRPGDAPATVPQASPSRPVSASVADMVAGVLPAVVSIRTSDGAGSGFIVSDDGLILTNRHVVDCERQVDVTFADGRTAEATVEAIDSLVDLALIRTEADALTSVPLGQASALEVGQPVVAIGNSKGYLANTVTSGVVSALWRQVYLDDDGEYRNLIQTDAPIFGGNSGGPLITLDGEVVGINSASAVIDEVVTAESLSFAIPSDLAAPIIEQALAGKDLSRPWLGVRHVPVDAGLVAGQELPVDHGALVWPRVGDDGETRPAVSPDSPAADAGIRKGDVIVAIDGQPVDDRHPLDNVLVTFDAGADVSVTVVRDGKEIELPVSLGKRDGRPVGC